MQRIVRPMTVLLTLAMALAAASASAQEKKERGKRGAGGDDPFRLPRSIQLSEEQQKKLGEIKEKFASKLAAAQKKAELSQEQRQAAREARSKAMGEGKRGAELQAAVDEAAKLTEDQKKGRDEVRSLTREISAAINEILTDEQRAARKQPSRGKRKQPA